MDVGASRARGDGASVVRVVEISEQARDQDAVRWKSRYLDALDAHERLERDAAARVGELGALLARLSRALPVGGDGLGKRLSTLAETLGKRPLEPRVGKEIQSIHQGVVDAMEAQERERAGLMQALDAAAGQLEALCPGRSLRRELKRFRASLSARRPVPADTLVNGLADLQRTALAAPPSQVPSKGTEDAFPEPDRTRIEALPALDAAPGTGLAAGSGPEHESGPAPAAQVEMAASVDWPQVRRVLASLLQRVELPAQFRDQGERLAASLAEELDEGRLLAVLEGLRDLIDAALAAMRSEFRGFLDSVDRRLDGLLGALGQVQADGAAASGLERGLASSMEASLAAMRSEAAAAQDLDDLKTSIDSHLECLVRSVQEFRTEGESLGSARDARLAAMSRRLRELESESREARGQLEAQRRLALTDALTGLPNRKALDERLATEIGTATRLGAPLALAMADIDHFKRINDGYGHRAGDRALALFAGIIRKRIRHSDFCARYGGEEFLLLFPGTEAEAAARVVDQVRAFVEGCDFSYKGEPVPLTASFGVTQAIPGESPAEVLERADRALYAAKSAGRNRVRRA